MEWDGAPVICRLRWTMYRITTPGYRKSDQSMRWALPDRAFFACGACHILAHVFLERYGDQDVEVLWIKPAPGFRKARQWWHGWHATLVPLPRDVLISEARSRAYDGLRLREPGQFLYDAFPRARAYLGRFPPPEASTIPACASW